MLGGATGSRRRVSTVRITSPLAMPASSASTQAASSAANTITALASNAMGVKSFVATLEIHASGSVAADLSGTLIEQAQPSQLVDVHTTVPSGLEAILAGDMAYLKIGALTQNAAKPWVEVPVSGLTSGAGASLAPVIQQLQASDLDSLVIRVDQ